MPSIEHLRRRTGALIVDGFFRNAARLAQLHPRARPAHHGVEVMHDLRYGPRDDQRLDVWRRTPRPGDPPAPALLYIHGGGFRILSKDTHWIMALGFARRGYVVFNIDYRLAPQHPYPAAVEDVAAAYVWVTEQASRYGADASRLVVAGESAGANLATAATLMACFRRDEPHARAVFATGVVPRAVLPACGIHQVTDPGRFARRKPHLSRFLRDRLEEVSHSYLGRAPTGDSPALDLADPVRWLEREDAPERALPPFLLTCGTADPLLDDTRRMNAALGRRGATVETRYYPGEPHAFHAFPFRKHARQHWHDTFDFLDRHLAAAVNASTPAPSMSR